MNGGFGVMGGGESLSSAIVRKSIGAGQNCIGGHNGNKIYESGKGMKGILNAQVTLIW